MRKTLDALEHSVLTFAHVTAVTILVVVSVVTLSQVGFRYILNRPLVWSEEFARYAFIWMSYLGLTITWHRGSVMRVPIIYERIPIRAQAMVDVLFILMRLSIEMIVVVEGTKLALTSGFLRSIALRIPWSVIYASAPVGIAMLIPLEINRMVSILSALRTNNLSPESPAQP